MKTEYEEYLQTVDIHLRANLHKRILEAIPLMEALSPEPLQDILITEGSDNEERRLYYSLYMFSEHYIAEANNIDGPSQTLYNLFILKNSVINLTLSLDNYDLKKAANRKSWVAFHVGLASDRNLQLRATRQNCEKVKQIYEKYIKPNYRVPHSESAANGSPIVPLPVG